MFSRNNLAALLHFEYSKNAIPSFSLERHHHSPHLKKGGKKCLDLGAGQSLLSN